MKTAQHLVKKIGGRDALKASKGNIGEMLSSFQQKRTAVTYVLFHISGRKRQSRQTNQYRYFLLISYFPGLT